MLRQNASQPTKKTSANATQHSYTVTDAEGEMYLCNSRCLCIWAVMLVTKHNLPQSERDRTFVVTNFVGKKRSVDKLMDLAQWAAANALGRPESEWLMKGRDARRNGDQIVGADLSLHREPYNLA
jgi:hypothetical protein